MVKSSILSFRSTKIVAQKSGHVNVFSMYFQIRHHPPAKSSPKRGKSCGAGSWKNQQIDMKTELKQQKICSVSENVAYSVNSYSSERFQREGENPTPMERLEEINARDKTCAQGCKSTILSAKSP